MSIELADSGNSPGGVGCPSLHPHIATAAAQKTTISKRFKLAPVVTDLVATGALTSDNSNEKTAVQGRETGLQMLVTGLGDQTGRGSTFDREFWKLLMVAGKCHFGGNALAPVLRTVSMAIALSPPLMFCMTM